uniref:EamA domain-containing protein n=1 Tax=Homalodisca liturata TaxID=320908 RepID=A0A1B6HNU9_9HEMI
MKTQVTKGILSGNLIESHFYYSFQAGLCASGGSIFGKLSSIQLSYIENTVIQQVISASFIILMIVSNAAVWTFFVKALRESSSSFIPTLSVAATNYFVSAIAGWLVFAESLSFMWGLGTLLILCGLALLASDSGEDQSSRKLK